jgi:hypothetical protein
MRAACVPNLGPRERARRLASGLFSLALAVLLAWPLSRAPVPLRALLFLPMLGAAYGVFQYLEKT